MASAGPQSAPTLPQSSTCNGHAGAVGYAGASELANAMRMGFSDYDVALYRECLAMELSDKTMYLTCKAMAFETVDDFLRHKARAQAKGWPVHALLYVSECGYRRGRTSVDGYARDPACSSRAGKPSYKQLRADSTFSAPGSDGPGSRTWTGSRWAFYGGGDNANDQPYKNYDDTPIPPREGWKGTFLTRSARCRTSTTSSSRTRGRPPEPLHSMSAVATKYEYESALRGYYKRLPAQRLRPVVLRSTE